LQRIENDQNTFGELFFRFCNDIQKMDLIEALQDLISFLLDLADYAKTVSAWKLKNQYQQWISREPSLIKNLITNFGWGN